MWLPSCSQWYLKSHGSQVMTLVTKKGSITPIFKKWGHSRFGLHFSIWSCDCFMLWNGVSRAGSRRGILTWSLMLLSKNSPSQKEQLLIPQKCRQPSCSNVWMYKRKDGYFSICVLKWSLVTNSLPNAINVLVFVAELLVYCPCWNFFIACSLLQTFPGFI